MPILDRDLYEEAKLNLNPSVFTSAKYRKEQITFIKTFIENCLQKGNMGSLYISGAPGTGKTLSVTKVLEELANEYSFRSVMVNCMGCRVPADVFVKILNQAGLETPKKKTEAQKLLTEALITPKKSRKRPPLTVIVLDEMDELESKNQDILYTIFEWPKLKDSRAIVVGISNTLDFTSRSLKRLNSLNVQDVECLHFPPYSTEQIMGILESRLPKLQDGSLLVKENALAFCARKISTSSGDIRKAFHIIRRSIELAESELRSSQPLRMITDEESNSGNPRKRRAANPSTTEVVPVSIRHVMKIVNETFAPKAFEVSSSNSIPIIQQLMLCSLVILVKFSGQKEVPVSKCQSIFSKVCQRKNLGYGIDSSSEFMTMCQLLESKGFVTLRLEKKTSINKISLNINEEEIEAAMTDKTLWRSIISDESYIRR